MKLTQFDEAIRAVALAKTVPEAKSWRDKAEAMVHWAKRAKNKQLLDNAIDIKMEAERKGGQLLIEMAKRGEREKKGGDKRSSNTVLLGRKKLADLGVTKIESHRWQAVARLPSIEWASKKQHVKGMAVATIEGDTAVVKAARAKRTQEKRERRATRERAVAETILSLPEKRYGVILADPEWRFEPWSRETGLDRAADNHYPTSALDVIKSRNVTSISADDCALFLWATVPMLPEALEVMETWGFKYRSHYVWLKDQIGTGYWNRNKHELLLVGTRGKVPAPAPGTQWESVIAAPVGKHSEKPEAFQRMIEEYYPTLPKIELNQRTARLGWDGWGDEAPLAAE